MVSPNIGGEGRVKPGSHDDILRLNDVTLWRDAREVEAAGNPVELTTKGFDLLAFLMENAGKVLSRDLLLDRVWGMDYPGETRTVDVHVGQLRKKLGQPGLIRRCAAPGTRPCGDELQRPLRVGPDPAMKSIRAKLLVSIGIAVLLAVGVTLGVGVALTRRSVEHAILTDLGNQANVVAVREANADFRQKQDLALRVFFRRQGVRLVIVPRPLPRDGTAVASLPDAIRSAIDSGQFAEGRTFVLGLDVFYVVRPAGDQAVILLRSSELGSSDWGPFLGGFLIAGLVGAALAVAATFFLARAISRPVVRVAQASRKVAVGDEPDPIPVEGSDEMAILADSFNRMAEQLRAAREAEQAFLLSVSHELKTPLTAIRGYAEGLHERAVDSVEAGEVIAREEARLERLVLDLLDLARLNQRTFTVRQEHVDLVEVAAECVRRYEPRARGFGLVLVVDAQDASPAWADPDRVLQVASNLVENALRITPAGGRVTVATQPGEIEVRDTGPGLSAEDIPRAFERFFLHRRYRAERSVGTGLGLAIVRDLTEAMRGTVAVKSVPGEGSAFFVRLPLPPTRPPEPVPPAASVGTAGAGGRAP